MVKESAKKSNANNSRLSLTPFTLEIAPVDIAISPIIYSMPLQLLAYHFALLKGTDVDQPRNFAKSVTVE